MDWIVEGNIINYSKLHVVHLLYQILFNHMVQDVILLKLTIVQHIT